MTEQRENPVARWQGVRDHLQAQLETERARIDKLKASKKSVALAALTTGGKSAEALEPANKDLVAATARIESRQRHRASRAAARRGQDRGRAPGRAR
jgi:hypothetical protein